MEDYKNGLVAKIIIETVKSCCRNLNVSFVWLGDDEPSSPIAFHVHRDVLRLALRPQNHSSNPNKFVFYYPEFSSKGATQVYAYSRPFLPVMKSPGHAVVMLTSQAKVGLSPITVLSPSLPLLALMFTAALMFGLVIWFLEHWNNAEEFPRPFFCGVFDGFWWAVVTMTTVGYGDKAPKSFIARLLTIVLMFSSFILFSLVAANTTSIIATQHLKRIQGTIGLKIGTHNSKDFVEREMNLGAEIKDFNSSYEMIQALFNEEIDRLLFPHYVHFLMVTARTDVIQEDLFVAKVLDQPFQLGLVLAHPTELKSVPGHEYFYTCLSSFSERQTQIIITNYSDIRERARKDIIPAVSMNTTSIMKLCKLLMVIVSGFIVLGFAWDLCSFLKKRSCKKIVLKNTNLELQ